MPLRDPRPACRTALIEGLLVVQDSLPEDLRAGRGPEDSGATACGVVCGRPGVHGQAPGGLRLEQLLPKKTPVRTSERDPLRGLVNRGSRWCPGREPSRAIASRVNSKARNFDVPYSRKTATPSSSIISVHRRKKSQPRGETRLDES